MSKTATYYFKDHFEKPAKKPKFNAVFVSDTHLGKTVTQAGLLYEFLNWVEADTIYLVGDIIDGWRLEEKKHLELPEMQARVIDTILAKAASGTKVIYIPGNHDEKLRSGKIIPRTDKGGKIHTFRDKKTGLSADVHFKLYDVYTDPAGKRIVVRHGDEFDPQRIKGKKGNYFSRVGDRLYDGLVVANSVPLKLSRKYLKTHFSLAAYVKRKTKKSLGIIDKFEKAVAKSVDKEKADGIICGHIHHAEITDFHGVTYMNDGDWVESCSSLVCDQKGNWRIVRWDRERTLYGHSRVPGKNDPNPYEDYRAVTKRLLKLMRAIWPPLLEGKIEKFRDHFRPKP